MSPRAAPTGHPKAQNRFILVKVGPKCSQSGSTLLKAVQNGSNAVKIGLKRVPRDPFRPNLFAFLLKIAQNRFQLSHNGSKWVPKGSKGVKMWSKRGQPVSKCAQLVSKWLKMASTPVKMGQNRLQRGPEGSHAAQRGQNGLKMASNTPKWPFPGQICLSPPERVHPALPDGWRWNWDPSAEGTPARFTISAKKCT